MKAMSIWTPWAWLFFPRWWQRVPEWRRTLGPDGPALAEPKNVENRSGGSPALAALRALLAERGPFRLALHAAKTENAETRAWAEHFGFFGGPRGCVLGTAEVYAVRYRTPRPLGEPAADGAPCSPWHERASYGIYLRDPHALEFPVEETGRQGLFDLSPRAAAEIAQAEAELSALSARLAEGNTAGIFPVTPEGWK